MTLAFSIQWSNFWDVDVLMAWLTGILLIFSIIFFAIFFSFGVANSRELFLRYGKSGALAIRFLSGIAIISFGFSVFGLLGFFNWVGILLTFFICTILAIINDRHGLKHAFSLLGNHLISNKLFWFAAVVISLNSMLLPFRNDELTYHLAYPELWFQNGEIFMDQTLRYPTYTFNFHVLALLGLVIDSITLIHLTHWAIAVFGAFFIKGLIERLTSNRIFSAIAFFAFIFTPIVQEFINSFYIDIPYQVYLFCACVVLGSTLKEKNTERGHYLVLAILSSFFLGIKVTGFLYIPLFLFFILYPFRIKTFSREKWLLISLMIPLASLWYLRSWYLTGDPIWPVINLNVFAEDVLWNKEDLDLMTTLIKKTQSQWGWKIIYLLPIELLTSVQGGPIRGWPVLSYSIVGIILPIVFLRKIIKDKFHLILAAFFSFTLLVWFATSIQIRYTYFLLFSLYFSIYGLNRIYKKWFDNKGTLRAIFFFSSVMGITFFSWPTALSFSKQFFGKKIYLDEEKARFQAAYDSEAISNIYGLRDMNIIEKDAVIYTFGFLQYRYYFYKNHLLVKGDDLGLYRNRDFKNSILENEAEKKLNSYDVDYLLIGLEKYEKTIPLLINQGFEIMHSNQDFMIGKITHQIQK